MIAGRWCLLIREMLHSRRSEECETCQEEQASVVAAAVLAPVAVHKDLALVVVAAASTAQEVFPLEETLLASLLPVATLLAFCPPVGGACGCGACAYGPTPIFVGGGGDDHADHVHEPCGGEMGSWPLMIFTGRSQPCCQPQRFFKN